MDRLANVMRTGGNAGLGAWAPGVMTTLILVGAAKARLIPDAFKPTLGRVPLVLWGAGAGYTFGLPDEDPTCAALKGAGGAMAAAVGLEMAGVV